jgi:hypothetical protein
LDQPKVICADVKALHRFAAEPIFIKTRTKQGRESPLWNNKDLAADEGSGQKISQYLRFRALQFFCALSLSHSFTACI